MGFIDVIKQRAIADKKTIVLPETEDRRTYEAAAQILKEGIANLVLVGSEEAVKKGSEGLDISGAVVVDPATSDRTAAYIDKLVELRKNKGMTPEQAKDILLNQYLYLSLIHIQMCIRDRVKEGHQAYVICPMVEDNELVDAENVIDYTDKMREDVYKRQNTTNS